MSRIVWRSALALASVLLGVSGAFAAEYQVVDLGTLGDLSSMATAINNRGQVAGWAESADGVDQTFVWQNGAVQRFGDFMVPTAINDSGQVVGTWSSRVWQDGIPVDILSGAGSATAWSINNLGQVVGEISYSDGTSHAFLWQSGAPAQFIESSISSDTTAHVATADINDIGQVVGSITRGYEQSAFLWQNGSETIDLGSLGGSYTRANAVNNLGQVVGQSRTGTTPGAIHAFIWNAGVMQDLGTLGGESEALDINASGQVVGWAYNTYGEKRAFVWQQGFGMQELLGLGGAPAVCAHAINDAGWIAGVSYTWKAEGDLLFYTPHATLWVPVPEPSSVLALVAGLAGIGGFALRRGRV